MKRWTRSVSPAASALILLVILCSIGLLGTRVFTRLDLTEKREYTLSRATKNVLGRLDDVVNVNVYFSRELPPYFATLDRQVKDLLDEYRAHGGDRLRVEFVDPATDPALETSMQRMGIPKLQLSRYQKERAEVMSAYLGIAVQFEDKTEVIPVVESVEKLEYDLTSALVKVSTERQTVGIATATSPTVPEELSQLEGILRQQYLPQTVNLSEGPVPSGIRALVVRDEDALTPVDLYRIDQYLMTGGRLLVLAGGVDVNLTNLFARNREVKLGPQLKSYGVEVQNALVVDAQSPMVGFDVGSFLPLAVRYPWFPQVVAEGLSKTSPITSDLQSLVLPWTSPLVLTPVDSSFGASVRADVLARSSPRSFAAQEPYDLNPQTPLSLPASGASPQVLVAALSGRFPSHWRGKAVPGDSIGTAPRGPDVSPETQILVVGGGNFLDGRFLQQYQTNAVFAANAVDWMSLSSDLIAIRSRGQTTRPLREIEDDQKGVLKALAMFPVPILVVVLGLIRAQLGKARRSRYLAEFGVKP